MSAAPKSSRRILIGAGSFADARAALRLVDRLAEGLVTEVGGMLVEETVVAELADLPRQRVITSSGTFVVAPSRRQIRTVIESDARAFRKMLSAMSQPQKWTFERRHGELISGLCEAAKGWDLLLLGHREIHRLTGRVVLIVPSVKASQTVEDLAEELASRLGTCTVRLSLVPAPAETPEISPQSECYDSEDALLQRIARIHASAVVLDLSAGPLRTNDQLRHLFAAARCPIVVVGAGQGDPSIEHSTQIPPAPEVAT